MSATKLLFLFVFCVNIIHVSTVSACLKCDIVRELYNFLESFLKRYIDPKYHNLECARYFFFRKEMLCDLSIMFNPITHKTCSFFRGPSRSIQLEFFQLGDVAPREIDITEWLKYSNDQLMNWCLALRDFNKPYWSPPTHYDFAQVFKKIILKWIPAYRKRIMNKDPLDTQDNFSECLEYLAEKAMRKFFSNVTLPPPRLNTKLVELFHQFHGSQ